ncbi:hypothetical protein SAMN02800694_3409 [Luteibacter sp. UNCMF331Sha3.1]|uniref:hypothetical protein n=1 Tax=Luteibacter sp. UNCMF331Sha3.1 TaxID=1502760 RepID=UPI0008D5C0E4|nr:hypothetical protein [Luteibacter sp. UNCMF331Sha3.1]SEN41192.1 hypothetical protein SAMN02800694_3409 [Luteibacter sp. UNCMF331Sha3.1]
MRDECLPADDELPAPTLPGHPDHRLRVDDVPGSADATLVFRVGPYAFHEGDRVTIVAGSPLGETDLVAVAPMAGHLSTVGNIDVEVAMSELRRLHGEVRVHAEVRSRGAAQPRSRSSEPLTLTVDL